RNPSPLFAAKEQCAARSQVGAADKRTRQLGPAAVVRRMDDDTAGGRAGCTDRARRSKNSTLTGEG
ncbi:MAG TPA: hypothetical protein P5111_07845, partial [Kiritimatiellia bacterium]|nr:hypothetical protein [Kiritimatiellia bacterium]